jgi:hypothetical protein
MSSKDIAAHVSMFISQDFRTWLEKMMPILAPRDFWVMHLVSVNDQLLLLQRNLLRPS